MMPACLIAIALFQPVWDESLRELSTTIASQGLHRSRFIKVVHTIAMTERERAHHNYSFIVNSELKHTECGWIINKARVLQRRQGQYETIIDESRFQNLRRQISMHAK